MACRPVSVAVSALLLVAQVTSAFVVPEVLLMRVKRSPDPMRSFSFSGFDPNGQMAAFTGLSAYPAFGNGYGPPPRAGPYHYGPPGQDAYGQSTQDSYGPPPSGAAEHQQQQPAADPNAPKQQNAPRPGPGANAAPPADSAEQQYNSVEQVDATRKPYKGRDGPSSNAEASFNAWFPIMFGVFPNGAGGGYGQSGNTAGRGGNSNNYQGQGGPQDQGPGTSSYGGNGYERSSGTTVIANSVSNGRNGVATSHAIAYGNPRSSQK